MRHRYGITLVVLLVALVLLVVACMLFGSVDIPAARVLDIVLGRGSDNRAWEIIVLNSRLPMIVTAALAGAALAVS